MSVLPYQHINEVINEQLEYVDKRRKGLIKPLYVRSEKFNKFTGGLEWNNIITISAQSGGGKTAIMTQWESEIPYLNKDMPIEVLTFSSEMLPRNIIARKQATMMKMTTKSIYSKDGTMMNDETYTLLQEKTNLLRGLDITYVSTMGEIKDIRDTIRYKRKKWVEKYGGLDKFGMLVFYDHTLLVKKAGIYVNDERLSIVDLLTMFNEEKKVGNTTIFPLSQTNRTLDDKERLNDPVRQYPEKRDIFGSDAAYQFSDIVFVMMNPYRNHIEQWGNDTNVKGKIYFHILKNREGSSGILVMKDLLKFNKITDWKEDGL